MKTKTNGGPAFPCDLTMYDAEVKETQQGMSLRDYFAANAMQAFITSSIQTLSEKFSDNSDTIILVVATASYEVADAMLKERTK